MTSSPASAVHLTVTAHKQCESDIITTSSESGLVVAAGSSLDATAGASCWELGRGPRHGCG